MFFCFVNSIILVSFHSYCRRFMGLDMYLRNQPNGGDELAYWRKAYILHDWFIDYAEKQGIKTMSYCERDDAPRACA